MEATPIDPKINATGSMRQEVLKAYPQAKFNDGGHRMPASEALRLFKAKKLSPVDLMQATIDRAEATKATINCFTFEHFDEAMALARKAEAKYAKGAKTGALEGLPIGIKDESYIKGKPTSHGSLLSRDAVGGHTSTMNERIMRNPKPTLPPTLICGNSA